ncbi:DUF4837 family protein [Flavobacterium beibuense]|uniref:Uncharacterized protein n=1 Tax=Flavobacterium beibuense TaxID=657326 RepID=A0A444WDM9_9FLAO|nr:DUF4837 family protein [Flavobacterium beibuense]RYJ43960.1 hypothetical protein NU09_1468 [Flavobacterium beibuense]
MSGAKQILYFVFILCIIGCNSDNSSDSSDSNINEISIIIDDVLWNGDVGDSLRKKLAAPVEGLTQEEPLFTLNQYNEKVFGGKLTKGRNIIVIDKDTINSFTEKTNRYCRPQNVFTIRGKNAQEILFLIEIHADEIIRAIKETEVNENQQRNIKSGLVSHGVFEKFGVCINVPSTYTYAINKSDFLWLKKDTPGGNTSLLLYRVPCNVIERDKTILNNIITMRDSVGARYIHGQDDNTFMVTEEAYSPYFFTTSYSNKMVFETRGNWEMKNDFMNGPFINYAVRDDKNNSYLVIEGFIYSPSSPKRDLIVELESIIRSAEFL